ncbi:DUF72 domain-containing protein [Pseudoduganella sp.]|uniref:DUF72 domain-containing protein n=1 Tax=Pseudoduganella sp. TaxID=1880898 RepID=UPI0035AFEE5A
MNIRVGIGGWDFPPWRETFYPPEVPLKRSLEYASSVLSSIEINGTFYRNAKPEHFADWAARTPDDFVFAVKASRYATNRKVLGEAGESIERFMQSGLSELGNKLGPILWQLAATKRFDPDDLEAFFKLLPAKLGTRKLQHVLDARHESFMCPEYLKLARKYKVATVLTDSPKFPNFSELTGPFVYARLMDARSEVATGYTRPALRRWAAQAHEWSGGGQRDVFVYFINGAKERAPAAAMQLLRELAKAR